MDERQGATGGGSDERLENSGVVHHQADLGLVSAADRFEGDPARLAVESGLWPLYRFDPRRIAEGQPPLSLDAQPTGARVSDLTKNETRFRMVEKLDPKRFQQLMAQAQVEETQRFAVYQHLAGLTIPRGEGEAGAAAPADEK